jgi:PAS domain S-box-containing protein
MENAEAIHVQLNSHTTRGSAAICRFSGCIMPAMASAGQGSERLNAQLLVDSIPTLIHTARPDGYLDYFNKPWLEYLGVTLDKVTGWNWTAFVHPEDVEGIVAKWRACLATGEVFEYETRVRSANGEYRWMFHRKVPLRDSNGNIVKWYGSSFDIEERKQAEEKLRRNERDLHSIIRTIPTMVWSAAPDGSVDFFNPRWLDYTGLSPDQSRDWKWTTPIHPDDLIRLTDVWQSILVSGEPGETEARLRRFDGAYRWFLFRANPLRDESGNIVKWYGINFDIEDRKRAEEALRSSGAYLAEAQRLSHTGSWAWSPDTDVRYWSEECYRVLGFDPRDGAPRMEELIQRIHPDDQPAFRESGKRARHSKLDEEVDYRIVHPGGAVRDIHSIGHPVFSPSGDLIEFTGTVLDITDRKRAEEALRTSEAYLAEAQRLTHTGSWAWSPDQDIRYWSEECYRVLSFDPQDGLPRFEEFFQRIHPDDQPGFRQLIQTAILEKAEWEADYRIVHPDGPVRDIHVLGHPVLSASGHLVEFVGTVIDVTERKQAEEERRRSEMELRQVLDFTPQLVSVFGPNRKRLYANRVVLDYLGIGLDEWRQRSLAIHIHPDDSERVKACWDLALRSGSGYDVELRLRKHDGSYRWFLARYNPVRDDKGQIMRWHVAGTDIEDRKKAEERLQQENVALREEIDKASMFEEIVGTSPALKAVLSRISKVAPSDSTVLITGETGTGKELVARAIHRRSDRVSRPFVSVNCAAIPRDLIASELFGHEKGAFTGATQQRLGRFELANGGTIFLDEVGELPVETQIALLRVLQEHEFERVGGNRRIRADVRVIAATNRDLQAAISAGSFRSDLFYRLNVFPIEVPSLQERGEDVSLLVEYFIDRYARKAGKNIKRVSKKTLELLQSYPWPGNIRELQNVIERSVILCETEIFSIDENWLPQQPQSFLRARPKNQIELPRRLDEQEKEMIEEALRASRGRVFGPTGAAAKLGIPRSTLESKIKLLKIDKSRFKTDPER